MHHLLNQNAVVIIDGALATELERHGADLQHPLWSARYLLSEPHRIARVHRDYLNAGAQILITASYQATVPGYTQHGYTAAEALTAIRASVDIARETRSSWAADSPSGKSLPLIAGSVGPYGAYTADGGEYRGNYGLNTAELTAFHMQRIETLVGAGVDILACETIPDLIEAEVLADCVSRFPGMTCWMSMSCRDGATTNAGQSIEAVAAAMNMHACVVALGVNCTAPQFVPEIVRRYAAHTDKAIIAYPNSGESYDATSKTWSGTVTTDDYVSAAATWVAAGARIIGGCCRTTPEHIRALVEHYADVNTSL